MAVCLATWLPGRLTAWPDGSLAGLLAESKKMLFINSYVQFYFQLTANRRDADHLNQKPQPMGCLCGDAV